MNIDDLDHIENFKYVREFNIDPRHGGGYEWRIRLAIPYDLGGVTKFQQLSQMGFAQSVPAAIEHMTHYIIKATLPEDDVTVAS